MKIKAKITSHTKLEDEILEEQLGSFVAKVFGLGAKASPKVADDLAKAAPKIAATLTGKSWMALSQLAKSPGAKEKLLDTISKAEKTNAPQLFSHTIAPGKQINFYVKPGGKISTKLTDAEKSLVKQSGGTVIEKIPSLKAQDAAVAVGKSSRASKPASAAEKIGRAGAGDEVVAGIVKKSDDVFEAPLVNTSGKVTKKVSLNAKQVALVEKFKNFITGLNVYFARSGPTLKKAKAARDAVLKANPKDIKLANQVFKKTMADGGLSEKVIKNELKRAKRLSDQFDKFGYHPQLAKGKYFGHTREMFKSKEIGFLEKIFGLKRGVLKTLLRDAKVGISSVFKTTLKLFALAALGIGGLIAYDSFYGIGAPGPGDDDIDLEGGYEDEEDFSTFVKIARPGSDMIASSGDKEFSKSIDVVAENISGIKIISNIKIISSEEAVIISEQRSQSELNKEKANFEKKYFSSLPEQFNQLDFLGPAGITHLFSHLMEDGKLKDLRAAAKISYGEFQKEMSDIYSSARNMDYLMTGLAAVDAATPIFTIVTTVLAKLFPSVGVAGFNLEMFDTEKFIKDVREDMLALNKDDWNDTVTPITYQIMLEPGTDNVEGFQNKLRQYAGSKFEGVEKYYKGDLKKDTEKRQEEIISKNSGEEISDLISKLSATEIQDFLNTVE